MNYQVADLLIRTYKESTKRTRGVFVILQLVAIIFLVGYFNHRFTWLRRSVQAYEMEKGAYGLDSPQMDTLENTLEYIHKVYLKSKELGGDLKFIDFDLVGLEVYIEDLPLLGALALTIIMTWFFYVNRRESGIIGEISKRISNETDPKMVEYLFYGSSFNLVFNTIKTIDEEEISFAQLMSVKIRRILLFLPVLLLGVVLIHDIAETFFVLTSYGVTVWEFFGSEEWVRGAEEGYWARAELIIRIVLTVPLLIYCFAQSMALKKFALEDAKKWKVIQDKFIEIRNEGQMPKEPV